MSVHFKMFLSLSLASSNRVFQGNKSVKKDYTKIDQWEININSYLFFNMALMFVSYLK